MSKVKANKTLKNIPTYIPKKAAEMPMFFEKKPYQGASGKIYPIPYSDGISDEKTDVEYTVFKIENEYIETEILPQFGGKILSAYDKIGNYDFVYRNEVVKPALVGIGGPWISGGIEFNWPQHHRPTTYLPLETVIEENSDGSKTVWTGEVDPMNRMKGMAGITVDEGRSYIKAKIRVYNRTDVPQLFMWWANLAVPVNDDYRTIFPPDVEWVNDHDRRAVLSWPIAKGVFHTARPFDYGEGTDMSRYDSVVVPSSFLISQGQSDMDFVAGYDEGIQKGIVTVANHHISPGKKMWTWGKGDFGEMWCSNLTDENGPYIELMTGVYTDNQPDFTWIAPYETREFEQYWYPVREIGDVKNATIDAAMNLEQHGDNVFFGFMVTGSFKNAKIVAKVGEKTIFEDTADLDPTKAYLKEIPFEGNFDDIKVGLYDENGKELVAYKPYVRGQKQPIDVREPVKRPSEIDNLEELYLNGLHLEQYKQHNYDPKDYYLEGLKRDPLDSRCNTGMARLSLKYGDFANCVVYADKAIKRLTVRNMHPVDTESYYLKGLALKYLGEFEKAYDELFKATWSSYYKAPAYFELANIDIKNGDYNGALEKLELVISLNTKNSRALCLKSALLRVMGQTEDAKSLAKTNVADDMLDLFALVELSHFEDVSKSIAQFKEKDENFIDVAVDYIEAGLFEDAIYTLKMAESDYPLINYYMAFCYNAMGKDFKEYLQKAEKKETGYCFPSRLSDVPVLNFAIKNNSGANAYYYLGCLFYDKFNYSYAARLFEKATEINNNHWIAYRNLAFAYYDHLNQPEKARLSMEKAIELYPFEPRLLMEYEQLLKNLNVTIDERLDVYEKYPELLKDRDDCYLDKLTLISMKGDYKTAINMAADKHFHIYEGGEGKLTKQHAWMHALYGVKLTEEGKFEDAAKIFENGINMPKSYGEAKTFFNQEAHIFYFLGNLLNKQGRGEEALKAYEEAAIYKAAVSEISLFRALALNKLNRFSEAEEVLNEMLEVAENKIINCDLRGYYGVGSPTPMPFELDIERQNLTDGNILKAYALLGFGKIDEANAAIENAAEKDPYDFRIYAYRQIVSVI